MKKSRPTKKILISFLVLSGMIILLSDVYAQTHPNEVWKSGSTYSWRINGSTAGKSSDLSTAINSCMGTDREVHVTTGGTLNSTLNAPGSNVKLYCHGNTFTCNFTGSGILNNGHDGFEIHDMTLENVVGGYGIRCSAASNLSFTELKLINIDWIGIRIDSKTSNPWNYTEYNLYMRDIYVDNVGSHGIETYSIDGVDFDGTMTVRNSSGGCGVLLNNSTNGTIETVDAYNCNWTGGYAGLRYANGCNNIITDSLFAEHCGRGFFIVQSGPTVNSHVNYAEIRDCADVGIWIENGTNCSVKAGCNNSGTSVSGPDSYANVTSSCDGDSVAGFTSFVQISNRNSNKCLNVAGNSPSDGANIIQETCNSSAWSQQFELVNTGSGYYQIMNRNSEKCLRVQNSSKSDGAYIIQETCNSAAWSQQFELVNVGSGYYQLMNRNSGKCLRVENSSKSDGALLVQETCNSGAWSQQFEIINVSELRLGQAVGDSKTSSYETLFKIYPNPVTDQMTVEIVNFTRKEFLNITDLIGKTVLSTPISKQRTTYDLSQLAKGTYLIYLDSFSSSQPTLFIKQ